MKQPGDGIHATSFIEICTYIETDKFIIEVESISVCMSKNEDNEVVGDIRRRKPNEVRQISITNCFIDVW